MTPVASELDGVQRRDHRRHDKNDGADGQEGDLYHACVEARADGAEEQDEREQHGEQDVVVRTLAGLRGLGELRRCRRLELRGVASIGELIPGRN